VPGAWLPTFLVAEESAGGPTGGSTIRTPLPRIPHATRAPGTEPAPWYRRPPTGSDGVHPYREEAEMRDMSDPRDLDRADVGQTNRPGAENKGGVGGWLGIQLKVWTVVIAVALIFLIVILVYAL
jgi:hypothetical protein